MCKRKAKSAGELLRHHQKKHGIIYCIYCNKAFNNQLSLSRHEYEHTLKRKYICNLCKESFPFQSQLTYHKRTHRNRRSYFCVFPTCGRKFKNCGDLNRHARTHTKKVYRCLDCDYTNPEKRNFESHRLRHSNIEPHVCPQCGEGFRFNTQKRRHMKNCMNKRSDSPAFKLCTYNYVLGCGNSLFLCKIRNFVLSCFGCGNNQLFFLILVLSKVMIIVCRCV